jgi:hypothetical protein
MDSSGFPGMGIPGQRTHPDSKSPVTFSRLDALGLADFSTDRSK